MNDAVTVMRAVCRAVVAERDHLGELDAALGDGDHGVSMAKTFSAVERRLDDLGDTTTAGVLDAVGVTILTAVGGAMGPLFGTAVRAAAASLDGRDPPSPHDIADAIGRARDSVAELGGARPGDKTMLDALEPAARAAQQAADAGSGCADVVTAAAAGASAGATQTASMWATVGRASRLGERSVGTADPGATSVAIILNAAADALTGIHTPTTPDGSA